MPIQAVTIDGRNGYRWGSSGKVYYGNGARARALRQARAVKASQSRNRRLVSREEAERLLSNALTLHHGEHDQKSHGRRGGSQVQMLDPDKVKLREVGQDESSIQALMKEVGGGKIETPIMAFKDGESIHVIDGHHRAIVARRKGLDLPGIVIPKSKYLEFKDQGFDDTKIKLAYAREVAGRTSNNVTHNVKAQRNPINSDPTRTGTLRARFQRAAHKRLNVIKRLIRELVVDEDAFGLRADNQLTLHHGEHDQKSHGRKGGRGLTSIESSIRNFPTEVGVVVKDGEEVLRLEGNESSITLPASIAADLKDSTFTHNHPSGGGFSSEDVLAAIQFDMSEIRAVGVDVNGDDVTYSLKRPSEGWHRGLYFEFRAAETQALTSISDKFLNGDFTSVKHADQNLGHEQMKLALSKLGTEKPTYARH